MCWCTPGGAVQRLLLFAHRKRSRAGSGGDGCLRVHRPVAGAAGRLRDRRRSAIDHGRGSPPRAVGGGRGGNLRAARSVRQPGPGAQLRRRHVSVRRAGQRQIDPGPADDDVFRAEGLDSAMPFTKTARSSTFSTRLATNRWTPGKSRSRKRSNHDRRWIRIGRPTVAGGRRTDDGQPGDPARRRAAIPTKRRCSSRAIADAC